MITEAQLKKLLIKYNYSDYEYDIFSNGDYQSVTLIGNHLCNYPLEDVTHAVDEHVISISTKEISAYYQECHDRYDSATCTATAFEVNTNFTKEILAYFTYPQYYIANEKGEPLSDGFYTPEAAETGAKESIYYKKGGMKYMILWEQRTTTERHFD